MVQLTETAVTKVREILDTQDPKPSGLRPLSLDLLCPARCPRARCARIRAVVISAPGGIRTHTARCLRARTLPVGLPGRSWP